MTCIRIEHGWLCGSPQYKYPYQGKTYYFEHHKYFSPHPLKKDGDPKAKPPHRYSKFWRMFSEFNKLSKEERKQYEV